MNLSPIDYRGRMVKAAAQMGDGALLVLAQPFAYRNSTVGHSYRQESFFYWLTGFAEQDSALVIAPKHPEGERFHLFLRDRDPDKEHWDGRRLGVAEALKKIPADRVYSIDQLWEKLPDIIGPSSHVYYSFGVSDQNDLKFIQALQMHKARHGKKGLSCRLPVHDAMYLAGKLRMRKTEAEIERMRAAAAITRKGFERMYRQVRPGMNEKEVHAILLGEYYAHGADMEAYGAIVAGGVNACILHYHDNNAALKDGDLLLVDSGAQFDYYASDVTRTFPVGRRFSPEQKAVYEVVLHAQKAAISMARPGNNLPMVHDEGVKVLTEGLISLGFLKGSRDENIEKSLYRKYFTHGTSHWIGMDVHDVGVYQEDGKPVVFEPGMYFSVEPGLYFDPSDAACPTGFKGIGVRIEDDVLITGTGCEVVTDGIAKELKELENRAGQGG